MQNAPTQSLLSVVNGILDESIERKTDEIPHVCIGRMCWRNCIGVTHKYIEYVCVSMYVCNCLCAYIHMCTCIVLEACSDIAFVTQRVACLLRKVVQEIERRISTQAEHLRTVINSFPFYF